MPNASVAWLILHKIWTAKRKSWGENAWKKDSTLFDRLTSWPVDRRTVPNAHWGWPQHTQTHTHWQKSMATRAIEHSCCHVRVCVCGWGCIDGTSGKNIEQLPSTKAKFQIDKAAPKIAPRVEREREKRTWLSTI